jgi:SAM-dependent methyltransferase
VSVQTNEAERRRWNDERWAALWPKRERMTDAVSPFVLEAASLQQGERVLDVGSGGGRLSFLAGRAVGASGSVVGADLSGPLGTLAAQRAREAGAENVEFRTVDMQTDPIPGDPFDVAISQFGVMFFDDPVTAFGNIRAHLRPDGRIAFACWQRLQDNHWHFASAIAEFLPPAPPSTAGAHPSGPFSFADPARTMGILEAAGFGGVRRTPHELTVDVPTDSIFDDIQLSLIGVAPEHHDAARAAVGEYLRQFAVTPELSRLPLAFQVFEAAVV